MKNDGEKNRKLKDDTASVAELQKNAVVLCAACSMADPETFLQENAALHGITKVAKSNGSDTPRECLDYLMAYDNDDDDGEEEEEDGKNTLYVAIRGCASLSEWIATATNDSDDGDQATAAEVLDKWTLQLPFSFFRQFLCQNGEKKNRIVFTGHSLGAAMALRAAEILHRSRKTSNFATMTGRATDASRLDENNDDDTRIYCLTFGAPWYHLRSSCKHTGGGAAHDYEEGYSDNTNNSSWCVGTKILHYLCEKDRVPLAMAQVTPLCYLHTPKTAETFLRVIGFWNSNESKTAIRLFQQHFSTREGKAVPIKAEEFGESEPKDDLEFPQSFHLLDSNKKWNEHWKECLAAASNNEALLTTTKDALEHHSIHWYAKSILALHLSRRPPLGCLGGFAVGDTEESSSSVPAFGWSPSSHSRLVQPLTFPRPEISKHKVGRISCSWKNFARTQTIRLDITGQNLGFLQRPLRPQQDLVLFSCHISSVDILHHSTSRLVLQLTATLPATTEQEEQQVLYFRPRWHFEPLQEEGIFIAIRRLSWYQSRREGIENCSVVELMACIRQCASEMEDTPTQHRESIRLIDAWLDESLQSLNDWRKKLLAFLVGERSGCRCGLLFQSHTKSEEGTKDAPTIMLLVASILQNETEKEAKQELEALLKILNMEDESHMTEWKLPSKVLEATALTPNDKDDGQQHQLLFRIRQAEIMVGIALAVVFPLLVRKAKEQSGRFFAATVAVGSLALAGLAFGVGGALVVQAIGGGAATIDGVIGAGATLTTASMLSMPFTLMGDLAYLLLHRSPYAFSQCAERLVLDGFVPNKNNNDGTKLEISDTEAATLLEMERHVLEWISKEGGDSGSSWDTMVQDPNLKGIYKKARAPILSFIGGLVNPIVSLRDELLSDAKDTCVVAFVGDDASMLSAQVVKGGHALGAEVVATNLRGVTIKAYPTGMLGEGGSQEMELFRATATTLDAVVVLLQPADLRRQSIGKLLDMVQDKKVYIGILVGVAGKNSPPQQIKNLVRDRSWFCQAFQMDESTVHLFAPDGGVNDWAKEYLWPNHGMLHGSGDLSLWLAKVASECLGENDAMTVEANDDDSHSENVASTHSRHTPPQQYLIRNANSGKVLDVYANRTANGSVVHLWEINSKESQRWTLTLDGCIISVPANRALSPCSSSGKLLGGSLQLWDSTGGPEQRWTFQANGRIHHPHSGKNLDVRFGSTGNGSHIRLWQPNGSEAQQWRLVPVDPLPEETRTLACEQEDEEEAFVVEVRKEDRRVSNRQRKEEEGEQPPSTEENGTDNDNEAVSHDVVDCGEEDEKARGCPDGADEDTRPIRDDATPASESSLEEVDAEKEKADPGQLIRFQDRTKRHFEDQHTEAVCNAAALSAASYQKYPVSYLCEESQLHHHSLDSFVVNHNDEKWDNGKAQYVLAYSDVCDTLYLAVCIATLDDWISTILQINGTVVDGGGQVHKGFQALAETLPYGFLLQHLGADEKKRVVIAGHSAGGAVAALAAMKLRRMVLCNEGTSDKIQCITFGAPRFGDEKTRMFLCPTGHRFQTGDIQQRKDPQTSVFQHYVATNDAVPWAMIHLLAFRTFPQNLLEKLRGLTCARGCKRNPSQPLSILLDQLRRSVSSADDDDAPPKYTFIGHYHLIDSDMGWDEYVSQIVEGTLDTSGFSLTWDGMKHHSMERYWLVLRTSF